MRFSTWLGSLLATCIGANLTAQTVLDDFTGPSAGAWTGTVSGVTSFANGATGATGLDDAGNGVLKLADGGFTAGALSVYSGLATEGFVTFSVRGRIVSENGMTLNLTNDPNSNPGIFGMAFGVAAGGVLNAPLGEQAFAYGSSLSTPADDSGQAFATYAATVRADGSGDFTAFFTPDQHDNVVGSGAWEVHLDDVTVYDTCAATTVLSRFATDAEGWAGIDATNSPFPQALTVATHDVANSGELALTDGGFTVGAFKTYAGAAPGAGIHVVLVDVRIVTDNGSLDRSRIAATAGGPTTTFADLSYSQSFATAASDTGQAVQTVAVPVITTGPSDVTVYVLGDYDAGVGSGAVEIRIDNVRISSPTSPTTASTAFSAACPAGYHTQSGPVLAFGSAPALGSNFIVQGSNLGNAAAVLYFGFEAAPFDLSTIGGIPGSKYCISPFAALPFDGQDRVAVTLPISTDPAQCGLSIACQWLAEDPLSLAALPLGSSEVGLITVGN